MITEFVLSNQDAKTNICSVLTCFENSACCKILRFLALFWKILGGWNTVMIQTVLHCLSSFIFKAFNRHFTLTINFQLNDPAL